MLDHFFRYPLDHSKLIFCFASWEVASNPHGRAGKLQTQETSTQHKQDDNSCKVPTATYGQPRKIIRYTETLDNGFGCTQTQQYMAISIDCACVEALVPRAYIAMTVVGPVVLLLMWCMWRFLCWMAPGRSSYGQCGSVQRSTHSQSSLRSYNELLYSHYSFMLHVSLH